MSARTAGRLLIWALMVLSCNWPVVAQDEQPPASAAGGTPASGNSAELAARIDELIKQLGDESFFVREKAQAELAALGFAAFDALTQAESNPDIEIASRVKYLLRRMQVELTVESDSPEVKQLLDGFELADEASRQERIDTLALMPDDQGVAPLCRLARFLKSDAWSKRAALAVMGQGMVFTPSEEIVTGLPCDQTAAEALAARRPAQQDPLQAFDDARWKLRTELIEHNVGASPRPAAQWLHAYTQLRDKSDTALAAWQPLVEGEIQVLERFPQQSDAQIVAVLLRQQLAWMQATGRTDAAEEVLLRMVQMERGEQGSLIELVHWLVEHQAWKAVDAAAERFAASIEQQPALTYTMAYARLKQGQTEKAEELAAKARAVNAQGHGEHFSAAIYLQNRGWIDWSEAEYRHVIELGPPENIYVLRSQLLLADLLHDRGDDLAAAEMLATADRVFLAEAEKGEEHAPSTGRDPEMTRARMNFLYGLYHASQNDTAKALAHYEKAIPFDPTDADVLIGLYRLEGLPEEKRKEIETMISEAATIYRGQIEQDPENSTPYNQLAWLLSNTGGDAQEAIKASERSLVLRENAPGYLDTLGRCYYAAGDYAKAVDVQTRAVQLEPQSGQMSRQLAIFKQALADAQGK